MCHSTLGLRVIKKKKERAETCSGRAIAVSALSQSVVSTLSSLKSLPRGRDLKSPRAHGEHSTRGERLVLDEPLLVDGQHTPFDPPFFYII